MNATAYGRHASKGFTLVEVMIAVIIFSITMLYGLSFFAFSARHVAKAKDYTFALQLARDALESAKLDAYDAVPIHPDARTATMPSEEGIQFSSRLTSRVVAAANAEPYKLVTVDVNWVDNGMPLQISVNTIISP